MAQEIKVRVSLNIRKGNLQYQNQPQSFNFDMVTSLPKGPVPGAFTVPTYGVACDLSELTTPGVCLIRNLDETNYVEYGIRDPNTGVFYPFGELGPGQSYPIVLSRNLLEGYTDTGTGTSGPTNQLWFKANTSSCNVSVEAFER